jgi:hypothetical protein
MTSCLRNWNIYIYILCAHANWHVQHQNKAVMLLALSRKSTFGISSGIPVILIDSPPGKYHYDILLGTELFHVLSSLLLSINYPTDNKCNALYTQVLFWSHANDFWKSGALEKSSVLNLRVYNFWKSCILKLLTTNVGSYSSETLSAEVEPKYYPDSNV